MSRPLRILFTNITLASRTGTEVYIKEAALGLLRRGHTPLVYSPDLGEIAAEIRAATIPVVDDLSKLGAPPDVIHGHHHQQAMTAFLHFPGVPGIFATHDWTIWHDAPPLSRASAATSRSTGRTATASSSSMGSRKSGSGSS